MNSSLRNRVALVLLSGLLVAACESQHRSELEARVSSHDAIIQQLPRSFYEPGMGDLMQSLQLRHAKLWHAARAENWELAQFELHEMHESFERVARWHAEEDGMPVGPAIEVHMRAGRAALEQSIATQDAVGFEAAFDQFTQGCNSCHQAMKHGFVFIQRPSVEPITNQRWSGR